MYQTRSEENGILYCGSIYSALEAAKKDKSIWKISFNAFNGERIRLVRLTHPDAEAQYFVLEQLADEVMKEMSEDDGWTDVPSY